MLPSTIISHPIDAQRAPPLSAMQRRQAVLLLLRVLGIDGIFQFPADRCFVFLPLDLLDLLASTQTAQRPGQRAEAVEQLLSCRGQA